MSNSGTAEVLIPRSLCLIEDIDNLIIDVEDLCSVSISWEDGFVFVSTLLGIFYDSLIQNYKLNNFAAIFLRASEGIRTPE